MTYQIHYTQSRMIDSPRIRASCSARKAGCTVDSEALGAFAMSWLLISSIGHYQGKQRRDFWNWNHLLVCILMTTALFFSDCNYFQAYSHFPLVSCTLLAFGQMSENPKAWYPSSSNLYNLGGLAGPKLKEVGAREETTTLLQSPRSSV